MSEWKIEFLPEADKDLEELDGNQRILVRKMINRVCENPLPNTEGGYGKPLGNKGGNNLTGLLKIKLKGSGLRIVYQLQKTEKGMLIVVIAARSDNEVYKLAGKRISNKELLTKSDL